MRIISGSARGRRLLSPKDLGIRPTSDRVKESLFNILAALLGTVAGLRVLDLFAGTGNLGIEALSRGAASAVFVDESSEAVVLVKRNLEATGCTDRGRVLQGDAFSLLKLLAGDDVPFGLVFLDPPYRVGLAEKALACLASSSLIDERSLVIVETAAREILPTASAQLQLFDRRIYGDTALAFYSLSQE